MIDLHAFYERHASLLGVSSVRVMVSSGEPDQVYGWPVAIIGVKPSGFEWATMWHCYDREEAIDVAEQLAKDSGAEVEHSTTHGLLVAMSGVGLGVKKGPETGDR